jgi:leucyl-tRNA synthetase
MGGKKMSKSRGNIVEPVEAFDSYGADALRLYMLFSGPPEQDFDWPDEGVEAIGRVAFTWLQRVWRLCEDHREVNDAGPLERGPQDLALTKDLHRTIEMVTADHENMSYNTAIARLMELVNQAYRYRAAGGANPQVMRELVETLLKLLAPMTPYLAEEQWHRYGHESSIHHERWPSFDPTLVTFEETTMVVQINGKVRATIEVRMDVSEDEMKELALASEKVLAQLAGRTPARIICKPPKLVNLVVPDLT